MPAYMPDRGMIAAALQPDALDVEEARRALADPDRPLHLVPRAQPLGTATINRLLAGDPFVHPVEGTPAEIATGLSGLGSDVSAEGSSLAGFFAAVTGCATLSGRIEIVVTDHCKRLHADFVDLRLITTLAGAGTEYALDGDVDKLQQVPTGWIGLFKGKRFGLSHRPCLHRSPPIATAGGPRLLFVLDTSAENSG